MAFGEETTDMEIKVQDEVIEGVKEFVYLGSLLTWNNDCTKEINRRTAKAKGVMAGLNTIWNSKQISYKTKLNVLKTCVFSTALYACETWTIKKTDKQGRRPGGTGGRSPPKFEVGDGPCIGPPIGPPGLWNRSSS